MACPKCESTDLEWTEEDESDGSGIYYHYRCVKCGFGWKVDGSDY